MPDASRKGNYLLELNSTVSEGNWELAYRVEQDVGGLEVAVDHRRVGVVEEGEALGRADGDLHPRHPWEGAVDTCSEKDVPCEFSVSSPALTKCCKHETRQHIQAASNLI